jgi:acetyltransferase-like isoleucine patch superfamily enzyme
MSAPFIHPMAVVDGADIGAGSSIWAFAHVQAGATVGRDCNIGDHCFVERGAVVGDGCTIKNGVSIWDGVILEPGAFVGPGVTFTNDRWPRSRRTSDGAPRYADDAWRLTTRVGPGATIGAGAILLPGVTVGSFALVGAGALVTHDVDAHRVVKGSPARPAGWVCACGEPCEAPPIRGSCGPCGHVLQDVPRTRDDRRSIA